MNKKLKICFRILLILIITFFIFIITTDFQNYIKIEEFSKISKIEEEDGYFYSFYQEYELEKIESILTKILEYYKYKICFRDEGSHISKDAFKGSNLIVSIIYSGEETEVAHYGFNKEDLTEVCFNIKDKNNITWNWGFRSNFEMVDSILREKEIRDFIITPKVATYLKTTPLYYILSFMLCFFYSGIFLWALTRIIQFIRDGFKTRWI